MKILITTPYFYPSVGGLERYVYSIAQKLCFDYHMEIVVVTSSDNKSITTETLDGIKIYRLPTLFKLSNTPINPNWYFHLREIIKKEKPDIINAHAPVPFMADMAYLAKNNNPFILTYHAGSMKKNNLLVDSIINVYEKNILPELIKNSDAVIAISPPFLKEKIAPIARSSWLIQPGVDLNQYKAAGKKRKNTVLFVGNIDNATKWKGLSTLISAIKILHMQGFPLNLRVVGDGNAVDLYKKQTVNYELENHVKFVGRRNGLDLVKEYQSSNILVLPSTSEAESFGMVLLEAMACGTNVIGSNIGGIPHLITHNKNGLLVEPGNPHELATAIRTLLKETVKANHLVTNGLITASKFQWENKTQKYMDVLSEIANKNERIPSIVQLTPYYPPHLGGMEQCVENITAGLKANNINTSVITTSLGFNNHFKTESLEITRLKAFELAHTPIPFGLIKKLFSLPKRSIIHLHIAQALFPEIVAFIAKVRGIPYVAHIHIDLGASGKLGFLLPLYKQLFLKRVLRNANKIIVLNNTQKKRVIQLYGLKTEKITIIPNGFENEYLFKRTIRPKKFIKLLFVGRLTTQKNIFKLLDVIPHVRNSVELHIVGDGELRSKAENIAKQLELSNVIFHGTLKGNALIEMYKASDIFILPSEREAFPLVLLEAMAMGLPIVANDTPEVREILNSMGILGNINNTVQFAHDIDTLIDNVPMRMHLSREVSKYSKKFSWNNTIDKLITVYNQIL